MCHEETSISAEQQQTHEPRKNIKNNAEESSSSAKFSDKHRVPPSYGTQNPLLYLYLYSLGHY